MMNNQLINLVQHLSETCFCIEARTCDANNEFPYKNFDLIKQHNLHTLLVPTEYGGLGASFKEYQQCLIEMAKGCAATASAFNMHNIIIGSLSGINLADVSARESARIKPFLEKIYSLVVNEKAIFAAATTEPGIGARFSQVKTHYQRNKDGYVLNGKKSFVTMANYADYYLVLANKYNESDSIDPAWLTYFIVPRESAGVSIHENWNTMGMRATCSHEVIFNNVQLPATSVFMGREGFALHKVMREPHWITGGYLGVYLGLMEASYRFTCDFLKERSNYTLQSGLAFQPLIQARVGHMTTMLHSSRLAVFAAKYIVGESAPQLTSLAIRTCGGSSIHKMYDLERYHRDSSCGALMPAVSDMCQLYLGKSALDVVEKQIW